MVLMVWSGDFTFDVAHGTFWSIFGVVILDFIFFLVFFSLACFLICISVFWVNRNADVLFKLQFHQTLEIAEFAWSCRIWADVGLKIARGSSLARISLPAASQWYFSYFSFFAFQAWCEALFLYGGVWAIQGGRSEFGRETPLIEDFSGLTTCFVTGRGGFCMIFKGDSHGINGLVR